MKKLTNGKNLADRIKFLGLFLMLFTGLFMNAQQGFCDSPFDPCNIAVVDYDKIAKGTQKYIELKKYQEKKSKELQEFMRAARENTAAEKNADKRFELQEKYNAEYKVRKAEIERYYSEKIKEIDNSINAKIQEKARNMGYALVLSKRGVLYGGEDITNVIEEGIK